MISGLNGPPPTQVERRGATGSPDGGSSLLFFGGIVLAIGLVSAGGPAIWNPEKDVSSKATKFATDPPPAESMPSLPPDPPPAVAEPAPVADPPADPPPDKKGKKGKGGKKKH